MLGVGEVKENQLVSFTSLYLKLPQSPSEAELVSRRILGTQMLV